VLCKTPLEYQLFLILVDLSFLFLVLLFARYTQALNMVPDSAVVLHNRAAAYMALSQFRAARRDAERAAELEPGVCEATHTHARTLARINTHTHTHTHTHTRARARAHTHTHTHHHHHHHHPTDKGRFGVRAGKCCLRLGELDAAEEHFKTALAKCETDDSAREQVGVIHRFTSHAPARLLVRA
jgi:Flp pilus assembly protein TadD